MLKATFEERGGALLVTPLVASLDAEAAPALRDLVGERARGRARVVLSLAHVSAADCSGLAGLVSVLKRMAPGGELRLAAVSRPVVALLAATHLDAVFPVYEDAAAALSS
jgi:anti-sigma B factor antagonist